MLYLKTLALVLPALSAAYTLKACTDTACEENCIDLSGDDVSSDTECNDFGIIAKSIYWMSGNNVIDAFAPVRDGCLGGSGDEDVQLGSASSAELACNDITNSQGAPDGVRWYLINNSGF